MATIRSLNDESFQSIFEAFSIAFANYEFQLSSNELKEMLKRRGYVPELSFGAFESGTLVSFTLNGIGLFNGIKTAYDTGTGTIKEFRGKGLATQIFKHSIPILKDANVKQYLLEVLQHNTKAVSIYNNLGFKVSREFNYFSNEIEKIRIGKTEKSKCTIEQIDLSYNKEMMKFWDFIPSWQNSLESVNRSLDNFIILGAFFEDNLIGYSIFEPISGDLTQIAVDKKHRRKGIATQLLNEVLKINKHNAIKVINTELNYTAITYFLKSVSIPIEGKQYEMIIQF